MLLLSAFLQPTLAGISYVSESFDLHSRSQESEVVMMLSVALKVLLLYISRIRFLQTIRFLQCTEVRHEFQHSCRFTLVKEKRTDAVSGNDID